MSDHHQMPSIEEDINLLTLDAKALQVLLDQGKITSLGLVRKYLAQIDRHDDKLHAMIQSSPLDLLEAKAKSLDEERASGKTRGPLHGIPIIIKVIRPRHICEASLTL